MADYQLTDKANAELDQIYEYSILNFGLNTPGIQICIPINRNIILIGRNEPFEEGVFPANDRLIGLTNTKLILSTNRFFYSSKSEMALVDDDINVYKHAITSNKAS